MTAEIIKQRINETFEDGLHEFVDAYFDGYDPEKKIEGLMEELQLTLFEDKDEIRHDSYGDENSTLQRIFIHKPTEQYFMLYGTRCSYQGTEWDGIKEVIKTQETITKYI